MSHSPQSAARPSLGPTWWGAPVLFLLAWGSILRVQNPGLMSDDSGEMVAAAVNLGLPHPPGYPVFDLLGRLVSLLPVGTLPFRFNLLSALVALACVGLVMASGAKVMASGAGSFPGSRFIRSALLTAAGISLLANRSFLAQSMTAKGLVYMLSLAVVSSLFWVRIGAADGKGLGKGWYFVLYLFSLGLANHWQTQVLLVPFLLLWLFQDPPRWDMRKVLVGLSMALVAVSPYLYLPLRAAAAVVPDWGHPDRFQRFLWVLSRKLSSDTEQMARGWDHYWVWGGKYLSLMAGSWWPGFWVLGLLGLYHLARIDRKLLLSSLVLYGTVLYALLTVARDEVIYLLNVYLVSIHGVFAFWAFLGASYLTGRLEEWSGALARVFLFCLALVLAGWVWTLTWSEDKSRYTIAEDMGINVLKGVPRDGLLLAEGDHYVMPILYQKYVLGLRPDMAFEPAPFLVHDWGWRQLAAQGPLYLEAVEGSPLFTGRLEGATRAAMTRGGLHYSLQRQKLEGPLRRLGGEWVPEGLTMAWKGRPGPKDEVESVRARVLGQRLRGLGIFRSDPDLDLSSSQIYLYYANGYFLASRYLASKGFGVLAGELYQAGLEMGSVSARARAREGLE